jgi:hypothetical protein
MAYLLIERCGTRCTDRSRVCGVPGEFRLGAHKMTGERGFEPRISACALWQREWEAERSVITYRLIPAKVLRRVGYHHGADALAGRAGSSEPDASLSALTAAQLKWETVSNTVRPHRAPGQQLNARRRMA